MGQTVAEIVELLRKADQESFPALERSLAADSRKGVRRAVDAARRRLEAQAAESARLSSLYDFDAGFGAHELVVGLDEVGRGPLAGPLTVGAVVLPATPLIEGLNDSKQIPPHRRTELAEEIKQVALAWAIASIPPELIDQQGITASLVQAFSQAVALIEEKGLRPELILLDGNPLNFDSRERNVIKGDAHSAAIAAASIIAKVERDAIMDEYAQIYPGYGFDHSKGYGSADHIDAIKRQGLTPIHRVSFCGKFLQASLFD